MLLAHFRAKHQTPFGALGLNGNDDMNRLLTRMATGGKLQGAVVACTKLAMRTAVATLVVQESADWCHSPARLSFGPFLHRLHEGVELEGVELAVQSLHSSAYFRWASADLKHLMVGPRGAEALMFRPSNCRSWASMLTLCRGAVTGGSDPRPSCYSTLAMK